MMPTLLQLAGAQYPTEFGGNSILPLEGVSLVPAFNGARLAPRSLHMEHEGNRMVRQGNWKLVAIEGKPGSCITSPMIPPRCTTSPKPTRRVQKMGEDWEV